jgi:hypothetical protein
MEGCLVKVLLEECDAVSGYILAFRELGFYEILEISNFISKDLSATENEPILLNELQRNQITTIADFPPHANGTLCRIQRIALPQDLPYLNHMGRELALMRTGRKPLSVFSGWKISETEKSIYSRFFDPLVDDGIFVREEFQFSNSGRFVEGSRYEKNFTLLYALKEESWRIPAYGMLRNSAAHAGGWSNDYERLFGTLLGYSDEENDAWLRRRTVNGLLWGCATLYLPIPAHQKFSAADELLGSIALGTGDSIDFYISEEGIEPVIEHLKKEDWRGVSLARIHMPYRHLRSFQNLSMNLGDQFGPFRVDKNSIAQITSLLEAPLEILDLTS